MSLFRDFCQLMVNQSIFALRCKFIKNFIRSKKIYPYFIFSLNFSYSAYFWRMMLMMPVTSDMLMTRSSFTSALSKMNVLTGLFKI